MRWLICSSLLLLASAQMAVAEVDAQAELFDEAEHIARLLEMTDKLLQSSDPTRQAAGLMMTQSLRWSEWASDNELPGEAEFLDHLMGLIERADTALARALLAHLCAARDIRGDCIRLGLDDAIVRYDGAELLARLTLTESDDTERLRDVIVEAQKLDERQMDHALLLLEAMEAHVGFTAAEASLAPLTFSLNVSPPYSPFFNICGSPSLTDPELVGHAAN